MIKGPAKKDLEVISKHAPYNNIVDFFTVVFEQKVSKKSVDPLIASNACSHLINNRVVLNEMYLELRRFKNLNKELIKEKLKNHVKKYDGQYPDDYSPAESMTKEFESYGYYLSAHPIEQYADRLKNLDVKTAGTIDSVNDQNTYVAGLVSNLQIRKTKRNTDYAVVTLDDGSKTFIFKSWNTQPLDNISKGDCAIFRVENSKYGWTLVRNSEVITLTD